MGKPNPRVGAVPKNRALPWYQDDGRGRDHLKGYMSKSRAEINALLRLQCAPNEPFCQ